MKTMIAALALVGLVACNTEKKSIADDSGASMPAAGHCEAKAASCDDKAKADCDKAAKAGCEKASMSSCSAKPQG